MPRAIGYEDIRVQQPNANALIIASILARKGRELLSRNVTVAGAGSSQPKKKP